MTKQGLTDLEVKHMKPDAKRREEPVGKPRGLFVVIHPSGRKSWILRYRYHGRPRGLTLEGAYPELGLSAARARAEAALEQLRAGIDPAATPEEKAEPDTVEAVAEEWLTRHIRVNVDWPEAERILKNNIVKPWKHRLITDIAKPDALRLLDGIVDRGAAVQANRTLAVLRAWFNWCIDRGILTSSPVAGVKPPTIEQSRDRVLTPAELEQVWTTADALRYPNGPFIRFLALSAQRRNEVATMKWSDVDLDNALWTLPKEQTKAGRVHDVTLAPVAVEILRTLPRFKYINDEGKEVEGEYVWTTTSGRIPINGFSKLKARLDKEILKRNTDAGIKETLEEWTLHDLRRTAATHMAKAGVPPHVLAAILNHTPGSTMGVTSIYNRFRYTDERRAALEAWAEYVVNLGKPIAKKASA